MNILAMMFHFPPMSGGGVVVAVELVNAFAKLGHKVSVITPNIKWSGPKYNPVLHSNVNVFRVDVPAKNQIKLAARMCKKNLQNKGEQLGAKENFNFVFSIFHPFHLVPKSAVTCAKNLGIPSIIKIDDAVFQKTNGLKSIQRKIEKTINAKTLQNASHLLVVNEQMKKTIINYYDIKNQNISIVPNGVDLSLFHQSNFHNQTSVTFSGAMYNHRGIDILLEAAPKVIEVIPNVKFNLIGDGPEINKLKDITFKKNLSKNIFFKGWINREKIPQELFNSNIGIGPLKSTEVTTNALPIKVLEYMASSLPIIAKAGTLPSDVLINQKNGFFIKDSIDLADKLILLLSDVELQKKMGKKSHEMIKKFNWENITSLIIDEYKKNHR